MAFLASDCALKYSLISLKSHFFRSEILDFSSEVISCKSRANRENLLTNYGHKTVKFFRAGLKFATVRSDHPTLPHTFLQSLKKFLRKISFVVYSWSNILAKNVATSSASGLSFMGFPGIIEVKQCLTCQRMCKLSSRVFKTILPS